MTTAEKASISWYEPSFARRLRPRVPVRVTDFLGKKPISMIGLLVLAYCFAVSSFWLMRPHADLRVISVALGMFVALVFLIVLIMGIVGYFVPLWVRIDATSVRFIEIRRKEIVQVSQLRRVTVISDPDGTSWLYFQWGDGERKVAVPRSVNTNELMQFFPRGILGETLRRKVEGCSDCVGKEP